MLHTILRDVNGIAPLAEVVDSVTTLAEVAVQFALAVHAPLAGRRHGLADLLDANAGLLVVGMGKLGGGELNVSSDIDLIFVHEEDGDASPNHSWHEFHTDLGKRLIRALDQVDENGFVFRVDMRLRPFGASGPLVTSLASLENYFITQARAWERYAWLKGRALSGHRQTMNGLTALVKPFVYRRYHDYAAIEEMRDLHSQIRAEAAKRNRLDDIKIGVGGIREVEFVAQLFQLIRGGREPALQTRSTREALDQLRIAGIFEAGRVTALQQAYRFLRTLEHRLQYLDDQQTQMLPRTDEDRQRIAGAMNLPDWPALVVALNAQRDVVTREFEALFAGAGKSAAAGSAPAGEADANSAPDGLAARCASIAEAAEDGARADIVRRVETWLGAARTQTLPAKSRARMESLIPLALAAALRMDATTRTVFRLFDLMDAIDKRETYLALLAEYPQVLDRVARIAASSAWAAEFLRRHPILMDELIVRPATIARGSGPIDWPQERQMLRAACDAAQNDVEKQYELLRHTKQVITLRLNVADIEGRLGVMALSDELTALAELLLDTAMVCAWRLLNPAPAAGEWTPPGGFAVIGYGKLGSKELGYSSDLDIVFLFDERQVGEPAKYAKLTQRLNGWLNTMTAGGVLYETDLRLRPDGDAGLLVSSLSAFRDYQLKRAWTWEHQALTRARFCAGDTALAAPFDAIRNEVLSLPRDRVALKAEIIAMRDKMRGEKKDRSDALDLKHTRGGIVDVEFIVQYLILAYSHEHPEFLGNLGNFALLTRAAALGILDGELAAQVGKAYLAYRERQHRARTNNELKTWVPRDDLAAERASVTAAWQSLLG
jgi:glutamate-ammonia-ligase adenylyltransferase